MIWLHYLLWQTVNVLVYFLMCPWRQQNFTLFKVISLPTRVSSDMSLQYSVDYSYLDLQNSQRAYLMSTETDYSHCKKREHHQLTRQYITHRQWRVCLAYFSRVQALTVSANENCFFSTKLLLFSVMEKCGFSTSRRDTKFFCDARHQRPTTPQNNNLRTRHISQYFWIPHCFRWGPDTSRLTWHITSRTRKPSFYLPDNISIDTEYETKQLENISPAVIQRLHDVQTKIATLKQTFDVDSLLHIHRKTLHQKQTTHWLIIITISLCATLILGNLCFLFYFRFHYILHIIPKPNDTTCSSPSPPTALSLECIEPKTEKQERFLFPSYPLSSC